MFRKVLPVCVFLVSQCVPFSQRTQLCRSHITNAIVEPRGKSDWTKLVVRSLMTFMTNEHNDSRMDPT